MVKSMLQNGTNFLFATQKTILSAATVIALAYGISAILSLLRTRILSAYFGDSSELAVFFVADRIPSFIYSVIVVGTLSSVFIPVFTSQLKKDDEEAWKMCSSIINVSLLAFLIFGVLSFIFAPQILGVLSLGKFTPEELEMGVNLMRIMTFSQLILIVSSFITSILQSFRYFIVPALAPILYNIGAILGIVILTPTMGIYSAAIAVGIGSVLHLIIQLPLLRGVKFTYSPLLDLRESGVREVFKLVPPRLLSSILVQLSMMIDTSLSVLVSRSSIVAFKFAEQLQSFPVNLFGVSIALAALPTLSYESDDKDYSKFKNTFLTSLHQMLFLVVPAAIVLLVLRVPVVRLIYGASKFSWPATLATSYAVAFFSLSIFSQSAVYLLTRAFYAFHDTKTPLKVLLLTMPLDVVISVFFVKYLGWGAWSIAFSFSIVSILDCILLMYLLSKRVGGFDWEALFNPFVKISYAALFMGISLYVPMKLLEEYIFDTTRTIPLFFLSLTACIFGFMSYMIFTKICDVKEVSLLYKVMARFGIKPSIVAAVQVTSAGTDEKESSL